MKVPGDVKLRPVYDWPDRKASDVDEEHLWLVGLHNDPAVLHNLTHSQPITMAHHLTWWEKTKHDSKQARKVFEVDGQRAGFAKFYDIDAANGCCVLGADLHKDFRGKGYAKHMWALMLHDAFGANGLHLHRVSLTTAEYNEVAQRVYRKLGFKEEGRLTQSLFRDGAYHDQIMMYMLRSDWERGAK